MQESLENVSALFKCFLELLNLISLSIYLKQSLFEVFQDVRS